MPDAIITSTASTFGTISGTFAADQSTVTGTVTGIVAGTLSGSVGVPGPAGPGVPAGGTAGQYLQKTTTGVDYATDWVTLNLSGYAPLASPAFTGNPTAPTAALGDNDTSLATTAFVQQELLSGTANAKNLEVYVRNQTGSTLAAGAIVYINGATGNRPTVTLAQANNDANSAQTMGFVKTAIANNGFGYVIVRGECENLDTSAVAEGTQLYLSPTVAGAYTTTKPSAPQHLVYVGIVIRSHPTQGVILVAVQNGYELNELHDVSITSPTNGQVLKYNSTTGLWYNGTDSAGVAWGGITGTLSNQTDLQTALDGKYSTTNPAGYITSSALTGYATETFVTSQGYITSAALSPYLTSATAASTYQTLSGMSSYLTTSAAASTYLTQANAASTYYLQTNPAGYITSSALSPYLTSATAASTYQTLSGMSSYLTTATATSTYATILEPSVDGILTVEPSGSNSATVQVNHDANNYIHLRAGVGQISMVYGGSTKWFFNDTYLQFPGGTQQTVAYPGPSGFLLKADNLSGLSNTGTARTNLGLGTMATETASNYLTTATAATTYAPLASPTFTGTPTLPTGTIAVTQSAGNNTTAVATTAFVQTSNPDASTTTKGHVELATVTEALRPDSSTLGMTPETTREMLMYPGYVQMFGGGNLGTSGAGASGSFTFASQRWHALASPNALTAGHAGYAFDYSFQGIGMAAMTRGSDARGRKWNSKIWASGRTILGQYAESVSGWNGDANTTARVMVGGRTTIGTGGMASSENGIGWKVAGGGSAALVLTVSNGTTLTETTSSFTPTLQEVFDWKLYSDGTGNVTLWVNDSQVATSTGGPTTSTAENFNLYLEIVEQTASAATRFAMGNFGTKVYWSQA